MLGTFLEDVRSASPVARHQDSAPATVFLSSESRFPIWQQAIWKCAFGKGLTRILLFALESSGPGGQARKPAGQRTMRQDVSTKDDNSNNQNV